jgi:hypothetical protein
LTSPSLRHLSTRATLTERPPGARSGAAGLGNLFPSLLQLG